MGRRRPWLVVVTGRPGAGKTTLARVLADALPCALLSRDALKAGLLQTLGVTHHELGGGANQLATQIFATTTAQLLQAGVSLVIEAAFQHAVWQPWLLRWSSDAEIRLIICQVADDLAHQRVLADALPIPHGSAFMAACRRRRRPISHRSRRFRPSSYRAKRRPIWRCCAASC